MGWASDSDAPGLRWRLRFVMRLRDRAAVADFQRGAFGNRFAVNREQLAQSSTCSRAASGSCDGCQPTVYQPGGGIRGSADLVHNQRFFSAGNGGMARPAAPPASGWERFGQTPPGRSVSDSAGGSGGRRLGSLWVSGASAIRSKAEVNSHGRCRLPRRLCGHAKRRLLMAADDTVIAGLPVVAGSRGAAGGGHRAAAATAESRMLNYVTALRETRSACGGCSSVGSSARLWFWMSRVQIPPAAPNSNVRTGHPGNRLFLRHR